MPPNKKGDKKEHETEGERYHVIYHDSMHDFVMKLKSASENTEKRLTIYSTEWGKFDDDTDNITIKGVINDQMTVTQKIDSPTYFKGKDILFVASFHNNDATMSQFHVLAHLCESFAKSMTVLLPYYSTATMERVDIGKDGVVPSANTLARLFNGLPSMGFPIRLMTYDLHTLQNRFYVSGHAYASLHTAIPLMLNEIKSQNEVTRIDAIAFPDGGAHKRFSNLFESEIKKEPVICGKVRVEDKRIVNVIDGKETLKDAKHILIVDDQTKSGSTIAECARELKKIAKEDGNTSIKISAFVTHVVFDNKFIAKNGGGLLMDLDNFYTTDSIPNIISLSVADSTIQVTVPRDKTTYTFTRTANIKVFGLATLVIEDL